MCVNPNVKPIDQCSCQTAGRNCTDICRCSDDVELCTNVEHIAREGDEYVVEDDEVDDEESDEDEL